MTIRCDLETAALLRGAEKLWQRAGLALPADLFAKPTLSAADNRRLQLAERFANSTAIGKADEPSALASIFGSVQIGHSITPGYLPVAPVNVAGPTIYPASHAPSADSLRKAYRDLVTHFADSARLIRPVAQANPLAYLEGLHLLMAQYAAHVPLAAQVRDVSLFDYSHIVAALTTCLRPVEDGEIERLLGLSGETLFAQDMPVATLIGGDIAGVQNFIYGLQTASRAAQSLRGRSFYLQLLTEAAQRYILQRLDMPITSVIYSGGAHFFLLAPLAAASHLLNDLRHDLTTILLDYHGRDLYLALGQADLKARDFREGEMSKRWSALHADLRRVKNRRYTELRPDERDERVFRPVMKPASVEADEDMFARMGRALPRAAYLLYGVAAPSAGGSIFDALGLRFALDTLGEPREPLHDAAYIVRLALADDAGKPAPTRGIVVDGVRYTINLIPEDKTFDQIADASAAYDVEGRPHGIQRLGILRMDVDNLGRLFAEGLGQRATLARIATLSRSLATFFEGRVGILCRQIEQGDPSIYAVYAGGDDVFLVGPWRLMPQLARLIRTEFDRLTGQHPDLTLSAGISLVARKYPLYQAAADAGEALDKSKSYSGKDAITFLDETLPWGASIGRVGESFASVETWAHKLIAQGQQSAQFPMGLLGRLMDLEAQRREDVKCGMNGQWGRWIWQGVYQLYRLRSQYQKDRTAELIGEILVTLQRDHFVNLPTLAFAARWAHLALRRSHDE